MKKRTPRRGRPVALLVLSIAALQVLAAVPAHAAFPITPDTTWMTNNKIYALVRHGDTIFVGGQFNGLRRCPKGVSCPGGVLTANNLAAFNANTGEPIASFRPNVSSSDAGAAVVRALEVSQDGSTLFVGGHFTHINGSAHQNIASIDIASAQVNDGFTASAGVAGTAGNTVYSLLAGPSNLYVGGAFSKLNNVFRSKIGALTLSGGLDTTFKPNANAAVYTMEFASDAASIFAGGAFTTMNATSRQSVARLSLNGTLHSWAIPAGTISSPQTAWDLEVTPTRLYGGFGHGPNYAAAFRLDNGDTGSQVWRYGTGGNVQNVELHSDGWLYTAGHFGINPISQNCSQPGPDPEINAIVRLNPATGAPDCSWLPNVVTYQSSTGKSFIGIWGLDVTESQLWIGGAWISISGVQQQNLARFTSI